MSTRFPNGLVANVESSSLNIGSGGAISYVKKAAVSVDLASIDTLAVVEATVTVSGAAAGDAVIATPPATLTTGLMVAGAYVSAANTVKLRVYNSTGIAVDAAAANWVFTLIR
jgi:hypothetical protein